jgi:hypothetical protein
MLGQRGPRSPACRMGHQDSVWWHTNTVYEEGEGMWRGGIGGGDKLQVVEVKVFRACITMQEIFWSCPGFGFGGGSGSALTSRDEGAGCCSTSFILGCCTQ